MTGTDNVGENTIKLSSLIIGDRGINEWFELQYKGKSAGRVHLICEWIPARPGQQMGGVPVSYSKC